MRHLLEIVVAVVAARPTEELLLAERPDPRFAFGFGFATTHFALRLVWAFIVTVRAVGAVHWCGIVGILEHWCIVSSNDVRYLLDDERMQGVVFCRKLTLSLLKIAGITV